MCAAICDAAYAKTVAVVYDANSSAISFAAKQISDTLERQGIACSAADLRRLEEVKSEKRIILANTDESIVQELLANEDTQNFPTLDEQGYSIRIVEDPNRVSYWVVGGGATGAMYGGLDVSDLLRGGASFANIQAVDKNPFIRKRGLKFNIPLDARTPSYSDNNIVAQANIPHMWEMEFWREYLDEMALNRLNRLTLWSLSPFPSMVRIPDYPDIGLDDVKRTTLAVDQFGRASSGRENVTPELLANLETVKRLTLDEKIKFWQDVMQYAHDRGVEVYIYTWNVFTFGTEGSGYGITPDVKNAVTKDYIRKATRALLETYPLLKGMGITAGENMSHDDKADEKFLFESYGRGINDALKADPQRAFHLSHRLGDVATAKEAFKDLHLRCSFGFTYKYSKAHVYSSVDPYWIHEHEFLETIGDSTPFFITIRDDSHNYLRGGSDPEFVRQYVRHIPNTESNFQGFQLGPDAIVWGREYVSRDPDTPHQLMLKKRWYSLRIWGQLSYDPDLPDSHFQRLLASRFPDVNSEPLFEAWTTASQIVPLVNRFHNYKAYLDYQWNPELCDSRAGYNSKSGFHDMDTFIRIKTQKEEGFIGIPEFVKGDTNGTTPIEVAEELIRLSETTLAAVDQVGGEGSTDKELRQTLSDIRALGYLGAYYGRKIAASTHYAFFKETGKTEYRDSTLAELQEASNEWWRYSHQLSSLYKPMYYSRLRKYVDVLQIQDYVNQEITDLGGDIPQRDMGSRVLGEAVSD